MTIQIKYVFKIDGEAEAMTTSTKVFEHMEAEGGLGPSNTTLLINIMDQIERKDLVNCIQEYEKKRTQNVSSNTSKFMVWLIYFLLNHWGM